MFDNTALAQRGCVCVVPDGGVIIRSKLLDITSFLADHGSSHLGGNEETCFKLVSATKSLRSECSRSASSGFVAHLLDSHIAVPVVGLSWHSAHYARCLI